METKLRKCWKWNFSQILSPFERLETYQTVLEDWWMLMHSSIHRFSITLTLLQMKSTLWYVTWLMQSCNIPTNSNIQHTTFNSNFCRVSLLDVKRYVRCIVWNFWNNIEKWERGISKVILFKNINVPTLYVGISHKTQLATMQTRIFDMDKLAPD